MAHFCVTIDGTTVMDGDLGQWTTEPPFISEQKLAIAAKRDQPWAIPILGLVAKVATGAGGMSVDVRTRGDGWDMSVTNGDQGAG